MDANEKNNTLVKLSELEALTGQDFSEAFRLAKEKGFKAVAWGEGPFPLNLFDKTFYFRLDDNDFIEKIWCAEKYINFGA